MISTDQTRPITSEDILNRVNKKASAFNERIDKLMEELGTTNTTLVDFVAAVTQDIDDLQDQIDGNITTWYYSGVPTLSNLPASDWTTDEDKNNHIGDLYYDKDTGNAYRFYYDNTLLVYGWLKLTDSDVAEALARANAAQDTADSKRKVYVSQPTVPYDIGDLWIKDDLSLYRCKIAEPADGSFNNADWIVATKYTDDTVASNALAVANSITQEVHANYVTNTTFVTETGKIEGNVTGLTSRMGVSEENINSLIIQTTGIETLTSRVTAIEDGYVQSASFQTYQEGAAATFASKTELTDGSVTKVKSSNFTFNENGIETSSEQSDTNILLGFQRNNNDEIEKEGLSLSTKSGKEILFAGFDKNIGNDGETIVRVDNMTTKHYQVAQYNDQDVWRREIINDSTYGLGYAFFYVGDDN